MTGVMARPGRDLSTADIGLIQGLLVEHPEWGRTRLSEARCRQWNWRNAQDRPKEMAARTLLLQVERSGHLRPSPRQRPSSNGLRHRRVPLVATAWAGASWPGARAP